MSCRKRYKIERKVREHNRKVRKEDKLNANKKKKTKDPGIPNMYPFKEQLLKQIQVIQDIIIVTSVSTEYSRTILFYDTIIPFSRGGGLV